MIIDTNKKTIRIEEPIKVIDLMEEIDLFFGGSKDMESYTIEPNANELTPREQTQLLHRWGNMRIKEIKKENVKYCIKLNEEYPDLCWYSQNCIRLGNLYRSYYNDYTTREKAILFDTKEEAEKHLQYDEIVCKCE